MDPFVEMLLWTALAGSCIPAGAALARIERIRPLWLEEEFRHFVIAFGGGVLLGAVTLVLVPEGVAHVPQPWAVAGLMLAGGLTFMALDRAQARCKRETPQFTAMAADFLPESLALGGMFAVGADGAVLLAILIGLQNLPEGFNAWRELGAGVLALCILDLYALLTERWLAGGGAEASQFALVGFHTTFNVLGVVLVLPFAEPFARFLTFLFPERGPAFTRRLDDHLLDHPPLVVYAATSTAADIVRHVTSAFGELLAPRHEAPAGPSETAALDDAIVRTRSFVDRIRSESLEPELQSRHAATIHILDHSLRLIHRGQQEDRVRTLHTEHRLRRLSLVLSDALNRSAEATIASEVERLHRIAQLLGRQRRRYRELMVMSAISAEVDTETALMRLDAMRWLYRVSYHLSRIARHMSCLERGVPPAGARDEIAGEVALD